MRQGVRRCDYVTLAVIAHAGVLSLALCVSVALGYTHGFVLELSHRAVTTRVN